MFKINKNLGIIIAVLIVIAAVMSLVVYKEMPNIIPVKPVADVDLDLHFQEFPQLGQIATLNFEATPHKNASNTTITIILPDGIEVIEGHTYWHGKLSANEKINFSLKVKAVKSGKFTIRATFFNEVSEQQIKYSKTELLGGNSFRLNFNVPDAINESKQNNESLRTRIRNDKPSADVDVKLVVSSSPKIGEVSILTFTIIPLGNEQNVTVQFIVPNGIQVIEGETQWRGDLEARKAHSFAIKIKPLEEGEYTLRGVVSNLKTGSGAGRKQDKF